VPEDFIGVFIVALVMLVPIITILTRHQQKMAMLFRDDRQNHTVDARLAQDNELLRKELADVKALLYEQSIAIDNLARSQGAGGELKERLEDRVQ